MISYLELLNVHKSKKLYFGVLCAKVVTNSVVFASPHNTKDLFYLKFSHGYQFVEIYELNRTK